MITAYARAKLEREHARDVAAIAGMQRRYAFRWLASAARRRLGAFGRSEARRRLAIAEARLELHAASIALVAAIRFGVIAMGSLAASIALRIAALR